MRVSVGVNSASWALARLIVPAQLSSARLISFGTRPGKPSNSQTTTDTLARPMRGVEVAATISGLRTGSAGPNALRQALRAHRGLRSASPIPTSLHRRGAEAQVSLLGGSRTTWERAATSQNAVFVMIDGVWPLPPQGRRSL